MLVEGNRGLFDGADAAGTHSTAELARLLGAPVVLVLDVTKATRTVAAVALGCAAFDPGLSLAGVVLNRVATRRQEQVIREALEESGGPPVLGAIPRLEPELLPGRHLGLVTPVEHPSLGEAIARAAAHVAEHVDLEALLAVAGTAPPLELPVRERQRTASRVRIGVLRDSAFSFYYPENLEALSDLGAELVPISPLADRKLPGVDALYAGGGFPEEHAGRLAENRPLRDALRQAVAAGLPVYAECGGLIYLARELRDGDARYPMAGLLDLVVERHARPCGHGYCEGRVEETNGFFAAGTRLRGHEFHYTRVVGEAPLRATVVRLERGTGLGRGRDGVVQGRVWASYLHLHALGTPAWAPGLATLARRHQQERLGVAAACG
jgi:cobyrinic acid a,c-diamide synthase